MTTNAPAAARPAPTLLPLFYKAPQLLSSKTHATWRLKEGDESFAAETPFVPVVVSELPAASRDYPVVFAADTMQPLVILGLERCNLFLEDGRWAADRYVPAYIRRYPFSFFATADSDSFVLSVDTSSDRVAQSGEDGAPLFENGKPSKLTEQALTFCQAFEADAKATKAFIDALNAQDLLIDRRADATLPDGRKLGLDGFKVVDAEKFSKLSNAIVLEWHDKGYLAWIHFHLASLDSFRTLLARQAMRGGATPASRPDVSETVPASDAHVA